MCVQLKGCIPLAASGVAAYGVIWMFHYLCFLATVIGSRSGRDIPTDYQHCSKSSPELYYKKNYS